MSLREGLATPAEIAGQELLKNLAIVQSWYTRRSLEVGANMLMDEALTEVIAFTGQLVLVRSLDERNGITLSHYVHNPHEDRYEYRADKRHPSVSEAVGRIQRTPYFGPNLTLDLEGERRLLRTRQYFRCRPLDEELRPLVHIEVLGK